MVSGNRRLNCELQLLKRHSTKQNRSHSTRNANTRVWRSMLENKTKENKSKGILYNERTKNRLSKWMLNKKSKKLEETKTRQEKNLTTATTKLQESHD